jgi:uncharacterized OsmC-like protein
MTSTIAAARTADLIVLATLARYARLRHVTEIRSALENVAGYLAENPDEATEVDAPATATLANGLSCRVEGPLGELTTDMSTALGGGGSAPSPGWVLRAALASCDATLVAMEAARSGIELTKLSVTVVSESDNRGVLGVGDAPPGPLSMRVRIELAASNAGEDELRELVHRAESHSAVLDAVSRAVPVTTEVVTG